MKEVSAVPRSYRWASVVAAAFLLVGAVSACGGDPNAAQSAPGLSCVNYALHGSGKFHNELSVHVKIHNSASRPVRYVVDVALTSGGAATSGARSAHVTIHGSVASRASADLARKVLTTDKVQRCRVAKVTRIGQS
jgi:hypothetical protein